MSETEAIKKIEQDLLKDEKIAPFIHAKKWRAEDIKQREEHKGFLQSLFDAVGKNFDGLSEKIAGLFERKEKADAEGFDAVAGKVTDVGMVVSKIEKVVSAKSDKAVLGALAELKDAVVNLKLSVNVEPPVVNVPDPKITIVKENDEAKTANELLAALIAKLSAVGGTVFIRNTDPQDAIPVVLTDTEKEKFYNAVMSAVSGGNVSPFINPNGKRVPANVDDDGDIQVDVKIDDNPLNQYKVGDVDDDASPNYYGFTDKDGAWYILQEVLSAGANTYRYAKGGSDYTTNWTNRASLSYDYFHNVF